MVELQIVELLLLGWIAWNTRNRPQIVLRATQPKPSPPAESEIVHVCRKDATGEYTKPVKRVRLNSMAYQSAYNTSGLAIKFPDGSVEEGVQ